MTGPQLDTWAPVAPLFVDSAHLHQGALRDEDGTPAAGRHWPFQLPLVLPELRIWPTPVHLFMFSAVTWNRHHIHYSAEAARAEGHPDVVVHRALIGNYFARHAGGWLGPEGRISRLSWRVTGSAVPLQWLRCNGVVQGVVGDGPPAADEAPVTLRYQAWITSEGEREVATAEGQLCIPAPF